MGQSPFWQGVTGVLLPGPSLSKERDKNIDAGLDAQNQAVDKAGNVQQANLEYVKQQNAGQANLGDQYLGWLAEGVNSGAYKNDESIMQAYRQFVPSEYQNQQIAGSQQYQYDQQRPGYSGPTQFMDYNQQQQQVQAPNQFQFDQSQPDPMQYNNPALQAPQNQQFQYNGDQQQQMQWNQQRQDAGQFQAGQRPGYQEAQTGQWQNDTFGGQKYKEDYQQYQGQQAPAARNVSDQFQTQQYQPTQQRQQAPDAQYFDPNTKQYQGKEFRVEDDPAYQRRLQQSSKAIENSAAAQGMQLSGANLKALQENAQSIASEEGAAAYDRYAQEDQKGYNRFQDQQSATSDAMRYQNQDQYNRYIDQNSQFESDRGFGADQNKEAFLREQATKQLGRELSNDEFSRWVQTDGKQYAQFADQRDWSTSQSNMNADRDWQQYTYEKGFGRDVYADDRNNAQQQAQLKNQYNTDTYNADRSFGYGQNQDQQNRYDTQYQQDFTNQMAMQGTNNAARQQNYQNAYGANQDYQNRALDLYGAQANVNNQQFQNQFAAQQANVGQYNTNRNFAYGANQDQFANQMAAANFNAGQGNQQFQNQLAAQQANFGNNLDLYNSQNANYSADRQFGADTSQQNWANNFAAQSANQQNAWNQYQYSTNMGYQQNQDQYGQLVDQYNRGATEKQNQYTRIGDIVNYGQQAKQNVAGAMGAYSDNMSDLAIQQGNAYAASTAAKNEKNTVLGRLGF